ncbi:MAG: hypothetical protein ACRCVV_22155 [Shewanella sp.]|uniref:hypothetical protein n=1 Tax=Aeromonas popoffii TaxID=70856 RepID=UPI003F2A92DC
MQITTSFRVSKEDTSPASAASIYWALDRMEQAINEWHQCQRPRRWMAAYGELISGSGYIYEQKVDRDTVELFKMTLKEVKSKYHTIKGEGGVIDTPDHRVLYSTH